MPIATNSRTRFKKLSYKAPVIVHRGNLQQSAQQVEVEGLDEHDTPNLGVDLSEVTEHHLQAALSSTQLAAEGDKSISAKPAYHIPTPDAKQVLDSKVYAELYRPGAYQDPVTYVRSSSTVEDAIKGPSYNLDEDDQEWLEARNEKAKEAAAVALKDMKPALLAKLTGGNSAKGKSREQTPAQLAAALGEENVEYRIINEDEMEMVMTVFEQVTSERVPFAHVDRSQLPSQEDFLTAFESDSSVAKLALPELPELSWEKEASTSAKGIKKPQVVEWSPANPWHNLSALKPIAPILYPWWKERREERQGKLIIPQLNFDESNDSDPYVCFRRREVKLTRKTRKTDVLHLEKLLKLRTEMDHAVEMLQNIAQREKTKRASLGQDRMLWDATKDLQDVKRAWGIAGPNAGQEDEDLISGEKRDEAGYGVGAAPRKKRRTEEAAAAAAAAASAAATAAASTSKGAKRPRPSVEPGSTAATAGTPVAAPSLGQAIMERAQAVQAYIERECLRRAETDVGWEEGSDAAYQPVPAPANIRNFRPIQSDAADVPPFASAPTLRSGRPPSFRRRLARGGRVFLDRRMLAPSPVPANLAEWPSRRDAPSLVNQRRPTSNLASSSVSSARTATSRQAQQPEVLTGPFAFASDLRPSLLNTLTQPASDDRGRSFVPLPASHSPHSDAASDSSQSTDRSKASTATSGAPSTVHTEVEEMDEVVSEDAENKQSHRYISSSDEESSDDEEDAEANVEERKRIQQERWRYDDESGHWAGLGLYGLGGMEDDDEAVLDDFDQRFMKYRMTLLEEEDFVKLSTDWTHVMQAQMAIDCPPPAPNVSVVGPTAAQAQQQHAAATAAAAAAQEARRGSAEVNGPKSAGGAGGNANRSNATPNAQAVQAAQLQAAQQHAQLRQQQAAAIAAATAAGAGGLGSLGGSATMLPPNVPSSMTALPPTSSSAVAARAAQTNVGGPLSALQQQQQIHQAQVQLAFQQHQQQQRQAAAAAAAQAQAQAQGRSSPNLAQQQAGNANRARMLSSSSGGQPAHAHPLAQNFGNGNAGSSSPLTAQNGQARFAGNPGFNGISAPNTAASSPQMQAAIANGSPPSGSSPLMQHQGQFPSQAGNQQLRLPQGNFQQQQPQVPQQPFNNAAMQHANSLAQLQQQLAAMQAVQAAGAGGAAAGGTNGMSGPSAAQLMAMKAALMNSQNQNLQLKLPANRALQINGGANGGGGPNGGAGGQGAPNGSG